MKDKFKILVITNQLLTTCGVSKHLLYFLTEAKKNLGFSFTIVCSGGDAVEKYKNLYDEIIILPESKHENRSVLNFIKSVISLAKLQSKNRFDLIHCHTHYSANLINFVSKFYKVKSLQTVHGIMDPVGRLNHYPAQYFISVNEHVHDFLIKNKKISTDKVKLIRNGILFNEKLLSQDKTKFKIISAGRLIKQKGFETYIKAISLLDEVTKRKAEFYLAGKGEEQNNLINLSKSLNVPLNFVGEIENLKGFLSTTHIFVNPSKSSNEGFPMTIIEAGYAKNLVISSDFTGFSSILVNNSNSIIFDRNDPDELAIKLSYAINNYSSLNNVIERMFNEVKEKFDLKTTTNKILDFYKEIIAK